MGLTVWYLRKGYNEFDLLFVGMFVPVVLALVGLLFGWGYKATRPPPPKICGSLGGPPVTSPRVRLSDGRHLAYREAGVPKEMAEHKIIIIHGYADSKDLFIPDSQVKYSFICFCKLRNT